MAQQPPLDQGSLIIEVSRLLLDAPQLAGFLWKSNKPQTHDPHKRQITMAPAEFKPVILASDRPHSHAIDRVCRVQLAVVMQVANSTVTGKKERKADKGNSQMIVALCRTAQSAQQLSMDRTVRGFEFRWEEIFTSPFTPRPVLEPKQSPLQWVPGLFPRSKATGVEHPTRSCVEVKNKSSYTSTSSRCLLLHVR